MQLRIPQTSEARWVEFLRSRGPWERLGILLKSLARWVFSLSHHNSMSTFSSRASAQTGEGLYSRVAESLDSIKQRVRGGGGR